MARARNIKPGFFTNDRLAECQPLARILFAGLWTIADREGRLEDRPKRIKAEVLPYDNCDGDELLAELEKQGFILRYEAGNGGKYIQILAFGKHQNPHKNEANSSIPAPCSEQAPEQHSTSTVQAPEQHRTNPADSLFIDSLIPDSVNQGLPPAQDADEPSRPARREGPSTALKPSDLIAEGVSDRVAVDFIAHRKAKRAPLTATALNGIRREAGLAMITLEDALRTCLEQGWQGFRADWHANLRRSSVGNGTARPSAIPDNNDTSWLDPELARRVGVIQ